LRVESVTEETVSVLPEITEFVQVETIDVVSLMVQTPEFCVVDVGVVQVVSSVVGSGVQVVSSVVGSGVQVVSSVVGSGVEVVSSVVGSGVEVVSSVVGSGSSVTVSQSTFSG